VLSMTQRKTPTVVHKQYQIGRIRQFYARKIKFAQQTFHDKLTKILTEFPKLDVRLINCLRYYLFNISKLHFCKIIC